MRNESKEERLFLKLKELTVSGNLNDDKIAKELNQADRFMVILLWSLFISVVLGVLSVSFGGQFCFFCDCLSSVALIVSLASCILFAYPLAKKSKIKKKLGFKHEKGFYVQDFGVFERNLVDASVTIECLCEFGREMLCRVLVLYRDIFKPKPDVRIFFNGNFVGWITSIVFGALLGFYASKSGETNLKSIFENPVMIFVGAYAFGFYLCFFDRVLSEGAGLGQQQRYEYVISLLECAIQMASGKENANSSPDRSMSFLAQLRNFVCK